MRTALQLFSLVGEARWASGRLVDSDNTVDDTALSWGIRPADSTAGFAGPADNLLEDQSAPRLTIHMHPRWVPYGTIKGWMPWRRVGQQPVFKTKVGFIRGAGGEVTFQVWVHHRAGGQQEWYKAAQITKRADGVLRELMADLSRHGGQDVSIELRVDAGESSGQDWAVWVDPQIEYEEVTSPAADALIITGAGNWSGVGSVVVLIEGEGGVAYGIALPAAQRPVAFPLGALGLQRGTRYRVLTIPQGGDDGSWVPLPAAGDLVIEPTGIVRSGVRFGDTVDMNAVVWAVDPVGPSRQLGAWRFSLTVGIGGLWELVNRGLNAPERLLDSLLGATPGQRISVSLEPDEAFGVPQPPRLTEVPLAELPGVPEIGMPFQLAGKDQIHWVVSIQGGNATLDVNHPWAGYRIRIEGTVGSVGTA